jgi:glucuronate isomerase
MTAPINMRPLMLLRLATTATQEIGSTPEGTLTIFPVTGGSFEGERLRGKVLAGGGDWVTRRSNGMMTLDLRVTLETDDGSLIHMTFTGIRDDANGYFRTVPRFETAAPRYAFLNRLLAVGTAEIRPEGPVHLIEEIL